VTIPKKPNHHTAKTRAKSLFLPVVTQNFLISNKIGFYCGRTFLLGCGKWRFTDGWRQISCGWSFFRLHYAKYTKRFDPFFSREYVPRIIRLSDIQKGFTFFLLFFEVSLCRIYFPFVITAAYSLREGEMRVRLYSCIPLVAIIRAGRPQHSPARFGPQPHRLTKLLFVKVPELHTYCSPFNDWKLK